MDMDWHNHSYEHMHRRRSGFMDTGRIISALNPSPEDIVIDVGSGDGIFSIELSQKVKEVYAVDVSNEAHKLMERRIREANVRNVHPLQADVCEGIPVKGFNAVLLVTSFHDFPCREELLDEFRRNSTGELKVAIAEFKKEETSMGPPMEIRIARDELDRLFSKHGFVSRYYDEMGPLYINRYELVPA